MVRRFQTKTALGGGRDDRAPEKVAKDSGFGYGPCDQRFGGYNGMDDECDSSPSDGPARGSVSTLGRVDKKSTIGAILGVVVTPVALVLAVLSGGAGHGDYLWARVLFPVLTFVMLAGGGAAVLPLTLFQYPLYGWFAGLCISKKQYARLGVAALLAHFIPMGAVLLFDSLNVVMICLVGDVLLAAVIVLVTFLKSRNRD
jgi:hypothetical protein